MSNCYTYLFDLIPDLSVLENEPLSRYTGFRTGGCSTVLIPYTPDAFIEAYKIILKNDVPFYVLGNGSNVLALDQGFDGVVLSTKKCFSCFSVEDSCIKAGAGMSLSEICKVALNHDLTGLEFAYGIPGSVGGAVYMNAGAYGSDISNVIKEASYIDESGNIVSIDASNLELSYRNSIFHKNKKWIIVSAVFALSPGDHQAISEKMNELLSRRIEKQPLDYPSCGSTFKRPEGSYASKLIDECGLKGFSVGGAAVSEKHAGFVINKGGATSEDILNLCDLVSKIVEEKTGFKLEMEIELLK